MNAPVIAIDGPSGAGKGTVSRRAAQRLGWHYLDSGAIYRALALAAQAKNVTLDDVPALADLAQRMDLRFVVESDDYRAWLGDTDITEQLPLENTSAAASQVAAWPEVRAALLQKQRDFRRAPGLVADGRDMGSVVFPDAPYKIFLTASLEERAQRRYRQLKEKGIDVNLDQITQDLEARDQRDRARAVAPLVMVEDALYIDSTLMTIEQVVEEVIALIHG